MSVSTWAWIILGIIVVLFAIVFAARQIPHARRYFRMKAM